MAEANEVFVHFFRGEKSLDDYDVVEEIRVFEEDRAERRRLAKDVGLNEGRVLPPFTSIRSIESLYQPVPDEACGAACEDEMTSRSASILGMQVSHQGGPLRDEAIPIGILEELALIKKINLFDYLCFAFDRGGQIVYGSMANSSKYLIAYWGDREFFGKLQERLKEALHPKPKPSETPPTPVVAPTPAPQPVVDSKKTIWHPISSAELLVVIGIIGVIAAIVLPFALYHRNKNKSEAVKNNTISTEKYVCRWSHYGCESVSDLPRGEIVKKETQFCADSRCPESVYVVWIKTQDGASFLSIRQVMKSVFDEIEVKAKPPMERKEY